VRASIPAALLLLLVAVAGCGSSSKQGNANQIGPAVRWTAEQPPQVAERAPASRTCAAADLDVQGQVTFVLNLGGGIAFVTLRNAGTHSCRLTGSPRVRFVKKGGPVQVQRRIPPETTYPASALLGWSGVFLRAVIPNQPIHVRRGGILHFRVVLTNASRTPARFAHCPAYVQQLAPSGKVEVYDLNCAAARPIAHGKQLAFAMQIRVPADAPLGGNGLFWALEPFGARGPHAHARVTVDR
jgi:hypothetical protein